MCPRIGHRQRGRNALGREEEIAALIPKLAVEFNGESIVALDDRSLVGRGGYRQLRRAYGYRQDEIRDEQRY